MTFQEELDVLHAQAIAAKDGICRVRIDSLYMPSEFLSEAIEGCKLSITHTNMIGDRLTPLEKLAIHVLKNVVAID